MGLYQVKGTPDAQIEKLSETPCGKVVFKTLMNGETHEAEKSLFDQLYEPVESKKSGSVRAKFRCHGTFNGNVLMHPVYSGSEENKSFWNATPAGQIQLQVTNQEALERFEAGKEYYVDFTLAE